MCENFVFFTCQLDLFVSVNFFILDESFFVHWCRDILTQTGRFAFARSFRISAGSWETYAHLDTSPGVGCVEQLAMLTDLRCQFSCSLFVRFSWVLCESAVRRGDSAFVLLKCGCFLHYRFSMPVMLFVPFLSLRCHLFRREK